MKWMNVTYASIGIWGLFLKDRSQRQFYRIHFTERDSANAGFFRNKNGVLLKR
jgi:hypothetical protein